jgi:adenylyl-sulfate kinase
VDERFASSGGARPRCYWLTGLSGAGKTTLAHAFRTELQKQGVGCIVLDGDEIRQGLNRDLGFTREDRRENVRRIAEMARLLINAGSHVIVAAISPYREDRHAARSRFGDRHFIEVHVAADQATCMARDPKGLYRRAQEGKLHNMTGLGDPYEAPSAPEIRIDTSVTSVRASVRELVEYDLTCRNTA